MRLGRSGTACTCFVGDDPALVGAGRESVGWRFTTSDDHPPSCRSAPGRVRELDATVVLAVGTDANIGKMTVMLQLRDALTARGVRAAFAPTGQTGIFIEGWGICVDAVIADFIAGAAEDVTIRAARDADIVLVEGQGSILHPGLLGRLARTAARQPAARADRVSPAEPRDVPTQRVAADPAACAT